MNLSERHNINEENPCGLTHNSLFSTPFVKDFADFTDKEKSVQSAESLVKNQGFMNRTPSISGTAVQPKRIFTFLVGYRWLSLIPPLAVLFSAGERPFLPALIIAAASNFLITIRHRQLNKALQSQSWLLLADLLLMAGIISFSGQWGSAFFLYALNPLLIAAFFFGLLGAVAATTVSLPLYGVMLFVSGNWGMMLNWVWVLTAVIGAYLISGTFGFAANLVKQLQTAQSKLTQTHSDLTLLHDLTVALQQAADVEAMQEVVLEAITSKLGFQRAVMGLVDEETAVLTGWVGQLREGSILTTKELTHPTQIPLSAEGGLVAQAVIEQRICQATEGPCTADNFLSTHFGMSGCRIFPMLMAERSIGVLLVDARQGPDIDERLPLLESVIGQTAVAIGSMLTRLNRARQTAVHEERIRFAQDLHDTVSQALFGIVFTLDGCIKLLPDQPEIVIPELERALASAETVRSEIRQTILDIWPTTLTAERFTADLRHYANHVIHFSGTQLTFDIRGDFASLSPLARRSLYRISQEALNNIATHARAEQARVCVDVENGRAQLVIRDDGQGFSLKSTLNRPADHDHFGLSGIQKRAETLGGECHIFSQPGAGTSIVVDIPV